MSDRGCDAARGTRPPVGGGLGEFLGDAAIVAGGLGLALILVLVGA